MNEKAILNINADGEPMSCGKGLDMEECGYKGGKVCGKCGAMAVMKKDDFADEKAVQVKPKKKPSMMDEDMADNENAPGDVTEDAAEGPMEDTPMEPDEEQMMRNRMMARRRRLQSMGMKSDDISDEGFLCAVERKMHPSGGNVCATCPGGCAPESNLPTILEVEGLAEEMFGGKVLDSGYGYNSDLFLVEMQRKDGKVIEVVFDGTSSECVGWQLLPDAVSELMGQKSALISANVIGIEEAADIAVKSIAGDIVTVEADEFEGIDAWVAEVAGFDGKSYDVFVSLNGEVLGYDAYTADEAAAIEEEVAEIALKRAYSDQQRTDMADSGMALPDGSFPIKDEADLQNAIQAFGRAKDKEAAKAHIMKRARALGMEEMIPQSWKMGKKDDEAAEGDEFLATLMEFEILATETDIDIS